MIDKKKVVADARYWSALLAPYARASDRTALLQLVSTTVLFALNWGAMLWSLGVSYLLTLVLAVPASFLLTRLFIFQHDCGHGAFFSTKKLNRLVGRGIGVLTLTPYLWWLRSHDHHHAHSGNLKYRDMGEVETITVAEYMRKPWYKRLGYWVYRHPVTLFLIGPTWLFAIRHRFPIKTPAKWERERRSITLTNLAILGVLGVVWMTIGLDRFLLVHGPIVVISGLIGVWLFYIQHNFKDTYWQDDPEWSFHDASLEGSSFYDLPAVAHWLTGNIGYHHIHHLMSGIPNYHLPECWAYLQERAQTDEELAERLKGVTRLTFLESLPCMFYQVWDEESRRLISIRKARRLHT